MPMRRAALTIIVAILSMMAYDVALGVIIAALKWHPSELWLYSLDKIGFAVLLALVITWLGAWRDLGFTGGAGWRRLWLLWPIWVDAGLAASQGVTDPVPLHMAGWVVISMAVAFGEETIFRGFVQGALGSARPRLAVIGSALLFGLVHIEGLAADFDPRIVLGQVAFAAGIGIVLGAVRHIARSIWPGLIAHAALDALGLMTTGGVGAAMQFSNDEIWFMLVSAAVAFAWGAFLLRRVRAPD